MIYIQTTAVSGRHALTKNINGTPKQYGRIFTIRQHKNTHDYEIFLRVDIFFAGFVSDTKYL